ncbi:DUF1684 domain-containing protein [Glaciibacter psychrotolerans]|uniref:DUF1684 domain-containing protein n=1 Tax=Glaciibacter psychrotolerans TaxID=670054 RepID=A0A7Z0J6B0_9MICO|nr:DUF1684 domain-containing protein [Leifsonia psychrotolerans]NYJ20195.1 hypothetical protein [Leifsonia psychrotolerans]
MTTSELSVKRYATDSAVDAARVGWARWRAARLATVVSATGNLALVETRWLDADVTTTLDDALEGQPASVTATALTRTNLSTGEPERGIRLWDSASPAIVNFDTVSVWDFDPSWVIEAEFTPVDADRTIPFEHIRDNGGSRNLVVPGDITFTRDGVGYTFSAFDDDGTLLLVFGDASNGVADDSGSYEAGRFLFVHRSASAFGEAGTVILDFNQAFVPPCGFSIHYNCPLPPRNNRFLVPVEAGEKAVQFRGGHSIY